MTAHASPGQGRLYVLQAQPAEILAITLESGDCEVILSGLSGFPDSIQVDVLGTTIFWTNMGAWPDRGELFDKRDGAIERCNLDGENPSVLVGGGTVVTPKQLQFEPRTGRLYWCDREGMGVMSCAWDGSDLTTLARTGQWPGDSAEVLRHCVGVAIDVANGKLYWTQKGPRDAEFGRIFRASLTPPRDVPTDERGDIELLLDRLSEPVDLQIDHARSQLYWTDRGNLQAGDSLNRADITSHGLTNRKLIASGLREGAGLALDRQQRRAFVGDRSGAIRAVSMDGGKFEILHQRPGPVTGLDFSPR